MIREAFGRLPLRVHLVLVLVLLAAFGLLGTWLIGSKVMESYLLGQVDARLTRISALAERGVGRGFGPWQQEVALLRRSDGSSADLTQVVGRRPDLPPVGDIASGEHVTVGSVGDSGARWRVVARQVDGGELVVATSQVDVDNAVDDLRRTFLLISIGALVLMAAAGYALVRSSMRPLEEVEATAEVIATGELSLRVPVRRPGSEVGRLATALNAMLGQIEQAFHARSRSEEAAKSSERRMRQFVADASHELRTPLTSIRGYAELYRQGAVTEPDDVAAVLRRIEDQAARMGLLVEDLLLLARLDQQRPLERARVDLAVLAVDAVHDAKVIAPDRPIALSLDLPSGGASVLGDETRLRQVIANLVGNALTHTPDDVHVEVRLSTTLVEGVPAARLEVADRGPGLTGEQRERIFERFYRADAARSRENGGTGLGLAIVSALVAAHGGRVELDTAPGEGAVFRVLLPLVIED
ncbi:HAMP domain-containing sensor histidine kinase [Umezawaea sp. Da 62-37]|uniref:sensor histidine kinase n=1 Tax=Umezawaea sp. Da 62-37 TaxID=3075927 RepID=UPI0028F7496B|nr:HAMP domain-containing sensor histidine kinase [Umezawaea sp. Da 62-37]WNV83957.1 HAMP domain-containing sensor histidine kinase [Umezawaea sp. Da 62-37]